MVPLFRVAWRVLFALALLAALPAAGSATTTYWQLILVYSDDKVQVERASVIAPMEKVPQTPDLEGAPGRISFDATWLDASGKQLFAGPMDVPLGQRIAFEPGSACQRHVPREGVVVLRVPGPDPATRPALLKFSQKALTGLAQRADSLPVAFSSKSLDAQVLSVEPAGDPHLLAGPISATKIRNTGPDSNRLVVVVLSEGYTQATLNTGQFTTDAANFVNAFIGRSPWDVYFGATNVYRLDVVSNQDGSDREDGFTLKDTYFNSTFWTSGVQRALTIDSTGLSRAILAADSFVGTGVWNFLFVIVNSTVYGGTGGEISVASRHESASEVFLHEMGHTYAGLADEYEDAYPGFPPGDSEPNVDFDSSGAALKWLVWVDAGTPLPTPETAAYANTVGSFQGARYLMTGIYRPWLNCLMRSLEVEFCPVCKEAHARRFFNYVVLADSLSPPNGGVIDVPPAGLNFVANPLPVSPLTYAWDLNEAPLGSTTNSQVLARTQISGTQTLHLTISHPTTFIRQEDIADEYTWSVRQSTPPDFNIAPTTVDFGTVDAIGAPYVNTTVSLDVINSFFVTGVSFTGSHPGEFFALLPPTPFVVPGDMSLGFVWMPTANDGATRNVTAHLSTNGIPATIDVALTGDTYSIPFRPIGHSILINELDADTAGSPDTGEFIELYNPTASAIDLGAEGYVMVFYDGASDASYGGLNLAGTIAPLDYFVIGDSATNPDLEIGTDDSLQDGTDAVALYRGTSISAFPNNTPVTTIPLGAVLVDALVYHTGDPVDSGLSPLLRPGQPQRDESGEGASEFHSLQRCPDGAGGPLRTSIYIPRFPNPGTSNSGECPPDADGDGMPNICETLDVTLLSATESTATNRLLPDSDGDGLLDGEESHSPGSCLFTAMELTISDPRKRDTDEDGWWDGVEYGRPSVFPGGPTEFDVGQTDADGDGVPNLLDPNESSADSDGDLFSDPYEVASFTNAASASSRPWLGDVTVSGAVDLADVAAMADANLDLAVLTLYGVADLNADGIVDLIDVSRLADYNLGLVILP